MLTGQSRLWSWGKLEKGKWWHSLAWHPCLVPAHSHHMRQQITSPLRPAGLSYAQGPALPMRQAHQLIMTLGSRQGGPLLSGLLISFHLCRSAGSCRSSCSSPAGTRCGCRLHWLLLHAGPRKCQARWQWWGCSCPPALTLPLGPVPGKALLLFHL